MQISTLAATILSLGAVSTAALVTNNTPTVAQSAPAMSVSSNDALMTMRLLEDKAWFIHAHNGKVRACTADGASVAGERPAPRCSNWSE